MEQDNLDRQIAAHGLGTPKVDVITRAVTARVLPAKLPYQRCPSDGWRPDFTSTNYVACAGILKNGDDSGCGFNPFDDVTALRATFVWLGKAGRPVIERRPRTLDDCGNLPDEGED